MDAQDKSAPLVKALSDSLTAFHNEATAALSPPGLKKPPKKTLEGLYLRYFAGYLQGQYAENLDTVLTVMSFKYGPQILSEGESSGEWPLKGNTQRRYQAQILGREGEKACNLVAQNTIGYQFTDAWGKGKDSPLKCVFGAAGEDELPTKVTTLANILDPAPSTTEFGPSNTSGGSKLYEFDLANMLYSDDNTKGGKYAQFLIEELLGGGILVWVNAMLKGLSSDGASEPYQAIRKSIQLVSSTQPVQLTTIEDAYEKYVNRQELVSILGIQVGLQIQGGQGDPKDTSLLLLKNDNAVPMIANAVAAMNQWNVNFPDALVNASSESILELLQKCNIDTPFKAPPLPQTPKGHSNEVARVNAALMSYKAMGDWIQWYYATALLNVKIGDSNLEKYSRTITRTNDKYVAADFMQTAGQACAAVASVSLPTYMKGIKTESPEPPAGEDSDSGMANISLIGPDLHVPLASPQSWWPRLAPFVQALGSAGVFEFLNQDSIQTLADRLPTLPENTHLSTVLGKVEEQLPSPYQTVRLVLSAESPQETLVVPVRDTWRDEQENYLAALSRLQSAGSACRARELLNFTNSSLAEQVQQFEAIIDEFKVSLWGVFATIADAVLNENPDQHVKRATALRIASARCFDATGTVGELSDAINTAITTFEAYGELVTTLVNGTGKNGGELIAIMTESAKQLNEARGRIKVAVNDLGEQLDGQAAAAPEIAAVVAAASLFVPSDFRSIDQNALEPIVAAMRSNMDIADWEASFNYRSQATRRNTAGAPSMFTGVWGGWQAIREGSLVFGMNEDGDGGGDQDGGGNEAIAAEEGATSQPYLDWGMNSDDPEIDYDSDDPDDQSMGSTTDSPRYLTSELRALLEEIEADMKSHVSKYYHELLEIRNLQTSDVVLQALRKRTDLTIRFCRQLYGFLKALMTYQPEDEILLSKLIQRPASRMSPDLTSLERARSMSPDSTSLERARSMSPDSTSFKRARSMLPVSTSSKLKRARSTSPAPTSSERPQNSTQIGWEGDGGDAARKAPKKKKTAKNSTRRQPATVKAVGRATVRRHRPKVPKRSPAKRSKQPKDRSAAMKLKAKRGAKTPTRKKPRASRRTARKKSYVR